MRIGDKKTDNVVKFTGCQKTDIMACYKKLTEETEEQKTIQIERKKREINEKAKKLF